MALSTRVQPIDRDVQLMLAQDLSPAAQSAAFATVARDMIGEADEANRLILGRVPPRKTYVDGAQSTALENVRPGGVIVAEWELIADVLLWIASDLIEHSPVGRTEAGDPHPGLYKRSHTLFADATEVPLGGEIPQAQEYVFMNLVEYARVIEQGKASRVGLQVYEQSAKRAASRFSNIAKIQFTYRGIVGGQQIQGGGTFFRGRAKNGRFVNAGGTRAHNVSSVRFPAISIRIG